MPCIITTSLRVAARPFPWIGFLWLFLALAAAPAQTPEWIWHLNGGKPPADNETRSFKKTFTLAQAPAKAVLLATADDEFNLSVNGKRVLAGTDWHHGYSKDVTGSLRQGENVLLAICHNQSSAAGFIARLQITLRDGSKQLIVSDSSWLASEQSNPAAGSWAAAKTLGELGVQPWGDILKGGEATPVSALTVLPGFKIQLVRSALPEEGSWVSMTVDDKGRLIVSPQQGPLLRMTLAPGGESVSKVETVTKDIGSAMGLLYAKGALYVNGIGPNGLGLYLLRDTKGDDQFDSSRFLKKMVGDGGEHGPHGLVLGPDGMIYQVNGNFVKVVPGAAPDSPHKHYAEDLLLPRLEDGNGFGVGNKPPGGHVLRFDPDGQKWEIFAAGQRNDYDIAFNEDGELFGFDSDMEWDWGLPWYRPIRINHIVSGADFGFREGSGKWPVWYPDSLPTTLDIGIGSPTGVIFGTKSKFPPKYRRAMFAMDWAYGRIFAVHLAPSGATYTATAETFIQARGRPLNVTDLEFGTDGAMYFLTGGRGTQAGLYRVTYEGPEIKEAQPGPEEASAAERGREARALRHRLEAFQTKKDPSAIEFIWQNLGSPDRWIRYAARIALENQDVSLWQDRVFQNDQPADTILTGSLALARLGDRSLESRILANLRNVHPDGLSREQTLAGLRLVEVVFARMGRPDTDTADSYLQGLGRHYPADNEPENRELCQLLVYLEAPDVVGKTLALLDAAPTQEEQIYYITALRNLKKGWSLEQHQHYFAWFQKSRANLSHTGDTLSWYRDAGRDYADGASFANFLKRIRRDAVDALSDDERGELAGVISGRPAPVQARVVERKFVKDWKMDDLLPGLGDVAKGRSFTKGKEVFTAAQCLACHRFGNEGGAVGPDLTAVFTRFTRRDVLESIVEPSKVVSEQYQNQNLTLKDGDLITGRIVEETPGQYSVVVNPLTQARVEVNKAEVVKKEASKISPMPEGLLSLFTRDEILDLMAYIESAGKSGAAIYKNN